MQHNNAAHADAPASVAADVRVTRSGNMEIIFRVLEGPTGGFPDIVNIDYDLEKLLVLFEPDSAVEPIHVTFDSPIGFKVLDEGDLLEFWDFFNLKDGWLFQIMSGGWLELESQRSGFVSQNFSDLKEYLVISENICVSVFGNSAPKVAGRNPHNRL